MSFLQTTELAKFTFVSPFFAFTPDACTDTKHEYGFFLKTCSFHWKRQYQDKNFVKDWAQGKDVRVEKGERGTE